MPLPAITGEFGIASDPIIGFTDSGKVWVRLRLVAKDRKRDSNGAWSDGDPQYMDCMVWSGEHLAESVSKGDSVVIVGELQERKWIDKESGTERSSWGITVGFGGSIGVSTRWMPAVTPTTSKDKGDSAPAASPETDEFAPPF